MKRILPILLLLLVAPGQLLGGPSSQFEIESPRLIMSGVRTDLVITTPSEAESDSALISCGELRDAWGAPLKNHPAAVSGGKIMLKDVTFAGSGEVAIHVTRADEVEEFRAHVIPGLLSLLPPLVAITVAFMFRQVLIALFFGIWLGTTVIYGYNPLLGFMRLLDTYVVNSLADPDHVKILIFSTTLGGMVGVISRSGGAQGIINTLARFADSRRGGQIATWAMGILIFFDDYANTLVVGNTMRPFTDRQRISREKLSYIVDSTAAPVAAIAPISTWVGFEIGLIDQAFQTIELSNDAYFTFFLSIPFNFYSILAVLFVLAVGWSLRDFGAMRLAEIRAATTGKVLRDGAEPLTDDQALGMNADASVTARWQNAIIPILAVIFLTFLGLYFSGKSELGEKAAEAHLGQIFGAANSFNILLYASFTGVFLAIVLAVGQGILKLGQAVEAWITGARAMLLAVLILILAWAIGSLCKDMKTADYVVGLARGILSPHFLPLVTFVVAAFIGFSTGTSWATMAILIPIAIPIAHQLSLEMALNAGVAQSILLGTIGAVLSGSVFGDHCSPISDTTILSSMASAADHIDHVRTQMPYALIVAVVSCLVGYLPVGFGFSPYLALALGMMLLVGWLYLVGKRHDEGEAASTKGA